MSDTRADAGKPSPHKQSHHKLAGLDPLAARREVLADDGETLVARCADAARRVDAPEPSLAPRGALSRLGRRLAGEAAKTLGLRRGEPIAKAELLRYAGTPASGAQPASTPDGSAAVLHGVLDAFTHRLALDEVAMHARVALHEAQAGVELLATRIAGHQGDADLSARRLGHLADRAHRLRQEPVELAVELVELESNLQSTRDVIDSTADLLQRTRQALDEARRLHETAPAEPGNASPHLADLLRQERAAEQGDAVQETPTESREERIRRLASNVDFLETLLLEQRQAHDGWMQRRQAVLARRQALEPEMTQTNHQAECANAALWAQGAAIERLGPHVEAAQGQVRRCEAGLAQAQARADAAARACEAADATACEALLRQGGPFAGDADRKALRGALEGWLGQWRSTRADALPPSFALGIVLEALGAAAGNRVGAAAELLAQAAATPLSALVPAPTAAERDKTAPGAALLELATALARQPSGIDVLTSLLSGGQPVTDTARAEAVRLHLIAHDVGRGLVPDAPDAADDRAWVEAARRGAARIVHAADPAGALVAAPAHERAAYRGFRNGYHSVAPGSAYARVNEHLKKLARWFVAHVEQQRTVLSAAAPTPFAALSDGLRVAAATALPTPARRAGQALEDAAAHLGDYVVALRAERLPGELPADAELGLQALAAHVRWQPEGTDLLALRLDRKAMKRIVARTGELRQSAHDKAAKTGAALSTRMPDPAIQAVWKELQAGRHSVREAFDLLRVCLQARPRPADAAEPAELSYWQAQAATLEQRFAGAVAQADRLVRDGDPARVRSADAFFALSNDMIRHLEWRDRWRLVGQRVRGGNLGPLSAAAGTACLPTGIGVKLTAGMQANEDNALEFYMGRTGMYLQLGEQATRQVQAGAGLNLGYLWRLGGHDSEAGVGVGASADWRTKRERGIEQGVQLRVLRLAGGKEPELMTQFLDMYEHLATLATRAQQSGHSGHSGQSDESPEDWLRELLTHHDNVNVGLIDAASRENRSNESNASFFAGLRLGEVDERPRRVNLAISGAIKSKADQSRAETSIQGYMSMLYRESGAQTRAEASARVAASVQAHGWRKGDSDADRHRQKASVGLAGLDVTGATEIRAEGVTHFCTLFTRDHKIDPVRSDCAADFLDFAAFETALRREWPTWVNYGSAGIPADLGFSDGMRYAVAERQLEDMLARSREFARHNKFASVFMDRALKANVAPLLDGLRSVSGLQREAGRVDEAQAHDRQFDDLMTRSEVWEPTLVLLREKGRRQAERGIDFFGKFQRNRIAEAMRTVAQWPLYNPVPRPADGRYPPPAASWKAAAGAD